MYDIYIYILFIYIIYIIYIIIYYRHIFIMYIYIYICTWIYISWSISWAPRLKALMRISLRLCWESFGLSQPLWILEFLGILRFFIEERYEHMGKMGKDLHPKTPSFDDKKPCLFYAFYVESFYISTSLKCWIHEKMAIELVDFPIKNGDFP